MRLTDFVSPEAIFANVRATNKKQLLQELSQRAAKLSGLDEREIFDALLHRERLGSTGIGEGVAIPHGKLERLDTVLAAVALSEPGVEFGAPDGKKSQVFVALLAPESGASLHLKALARISRIFSSPGLLERLLQAGNEDEILQTLVDEDARLA